MKQLLLVVGLIWFAAPAAQGQDPLYISPDVATDPDGAPAYLPWDVDQNTSSGGPAFYGR